MGQSQSQVTQSKPHLNKSVVINGLKTKKADLYEENFNKELLQSEIKVMVLFEQDYFNEF